MKKWKLPRLLRESSNRPRKISSSEGNIDRKFGVSYCFSISNRRNVATVFTSILLLPRVEGGEGEKNHTADDRREWVERVTFHKRCEKTALPTGGEREKERKGSRVESQICICNITPDHWSSTDRSMLYRLTELYLYQKSAVLRVAYTTPRKTSIHRSGTPRAHPRSQAV